MSINAIDLRTSALRGVDQGAGIGDGMRSLGEPGAGEGERVSFGSILGNLVGEASQLEHTASVKSEQVARGTLDDLHGTMIAVKEAEISMKLVGSVRNKLIDAFQEIWRTNV